MKSPADPYEFFRWKSSCGRLVVRTTWVKGVRHAILSDDDDDDDDVDKCTPPPKKERHARRPRRSNSENDAVVAEQTANDDRLPSNVAAVADDDYVDRVLRWLHKPTGSMLETCRKPMSAPSAGTGVCSSRRLALVKTCSIPGNKSERQQVVGIAERPMTTTTTTRSVVVSAAGNCTKNRHKIELHVHMPSVC